MGIFKHLRSIKAESIFLFVALLYSVFLHWKLGMDAFWDTANYHYYIGWAATKFAPYRYGALAQMHTFFNPLIDVVNYNMFARSPYMGAVFHSLSFAVSLLAVYKITLKALGSFQKNAKFWACIACAIGGTAAMAVSLFGSFTNEHITAMFILWALWGVLEFVQDPTKQSLAVASGIATGAAVAFKLTALPYAASLWLALACFSRDSLKNLLLFTSGLAGGYFIFEGPFWILRFMEFGNPVFPFANNIFHSPYFAAQQISYGQFESSKLFLYLAQPLRWLYSGDFAEGAAANVRDGRILLAFFGIFAFGLGSLFQRTSRLNRNSLFLILFFLTSWLLWIFLFRIYRYLVVLELISGSLFVMGLVQIRLIPNQMKLRACLVIAATVAFLTSTTVYPCWGRRNWRRQFAQATFPSPAPSGGQLVFLADQRLSYLAPQLVKDGAEVASFYSQPWVSTGNNGGVIDPKPVVIQNPNDVFFLQYTQRDPRLDSAYLAKLMGDRIFISKPVKTQMGWSPLICRFAPVSEIPTLQENRTYKQDDDELFFPSGWTAMDRHFRWSEGKKASLQFRLAKASLDQGPVRIHIEGNFLGEQQIKALVSGREKTNQTFTDKGQFDVDITQEDIDKNGFVKIEFERPQARTPGNGDPRVLAFAFKSLKMAPR